MANPKTGTVFNTKGHTVDLDDGRILEPSATAENVKLGNAHNAALIEAGTIVVVGDSKDDDAAADDEDAVAKPETTRTSNRAGTGPQEV